MKFASHYHLVFVLKVGSNKTCAILYHRDRRTRAFHRHHARHKAHRLYIPRIAKGRTWRVSLVVLINGYNLDELGIHVVSDINFLTLLCIPCWRDVLSVSHNEHLKKPSSPARLSDSLSPHNAQVPSDLFIPKVELGMHLKGSGRVSRKNWLGVDILSVVLC